MSDITTQHTDFVGAGLRPAQGRLGNLPLQENADLLLDLVRIYSPSGQEAPAVNYLVDWLNTNGFSAHADEAGNAVGVRGPADAAHTILLLGHIDTVPGQIPVRVEDGILYGRGSVDAKGSLCAFVQAAAEADLPEGWRVMVIGAVGEEAHSPGAYHVRDHYAEPDLCIIGEPSGAGRITLGYKGHLLIDYTLTRPLAHSARPEPSVGALGAALWESIRAWAVASNNGTERLFDQVMPHLSAIHTQSDGFHDTLNMTISFRLPPGVTPEDVIAAVSSFAEPDATLHAYSAEPAYLGDKNNSLVRGLLAAIRAQGERPGFVLKSGTSDMNVVGEWWRCPMVAYGPGDSNLDHTPDEHLPLDEYAAAVAVLRHLLENLR
jgi:LysW-gamma-L-lysine carboxypeptidase